MMRILDPTIRVAGVSAAAQLAPRPARLAGVTVGLLANGKSNGMVLLDRLADRLRERWGIGEVVRLSKTNASVPLTEEHAEPLIKQCAAVITAIGD
jgi:hypothetical protein